METTLLNGRYSKPEAEDLIQKLFKVKTDFHLSRIDKHISEEDLFHSEKRITELQNELGRILGHLRNSSFQHVAINAKMILEFCPDYHIGSEI